MPKRPRGFTLIELMIVVAIIGILAAIAIPKFAQMMRKSTEGATKGNLGSYRSALNIYYGDMEGQYPSDPLSITVTGKYLQAIPTAKAPYYHADSSVTSIGTMAAPADAGGWIYDNTIGDQNYGGAFVSCTHTDSKGTMWEAY